MALRKYLPLLIISSIILVSACSTEQSVPGSYKPRWPAIVGGAGVGGVTSAAYGGMTNSGTAASALAGAMLGSSIAAYKDTEVLIQHLQDQGVTVIRLGNILEVVIPADLVFRGNENEIMTSSYPLMDSVVRLLQQYGNSKMTVNAHTDNVGSQLARLDRSLKQAQSITTYLWVHGVSLELMDFNGIGNVVTVASDHSARGSGYNRRIEIAVWQNTPPSPLKVFTFGRRRQLTS